MNRAENNRDFIEIVLLVLLTFIIVILLRSSFNRQANKVVVKVSDLTSVTELRRDLSSENRILAETTATSGIRHSL